MDVFEQRRGRVVEYESDRGLGTLVGIETNGTDGVVLTFHCTSIADGSREIADGAEVVYRVGAVGPGIWEAIDVRNIASS